MSRFNKNKTIVISIKKLTATLLLDTTLAYSSTTSHILAMRLRVVQKNYSEAISIKLFNDPQYNRLSNSFLIFIKTNILLKLYHSLPPINRCSLIVNALCLPFERWTIYLFFPGGNYFLSLLLPNPSWEFMMILWC